MAIFAVRQVVTARIFAIYLQQVPVRLSDLPSPVFFREGNEAFKAAKLVFNPEKFFFRHRPVEDVERFVAQIDAAETVMTADAIHQKRRVGAILRVLRIAQVVAAVAIRAFVQ